MSKFLDETGLSQLWEKIKLRFLDSTTKYASSPTIGGPADKAISIPFGVVDSTSTATAFTATVDGIPMYNAETSPTLADGTCVYLSNPVVTSAAKSTAPKCWTLNINGYGAKPVYVTTAAATYSTTHFTKNYKMLFVYDDSLNSGNGGWYIGQLFNSNTTYSDMTQAEINAGTGTTGRKITPKMLRDNFYTEDEVDGLLDGKQDTINDLVDIRSGAALGATAIQPTDIKDELDPGGNGEIADSAAIAAYVEDAISDKVENVELRHGDTYVLPYDAQVEYLEGSGTQYIDTGILPDKDTSIEIDLKLNQIVGTRYVLGRYASSQQFYLYVSGTKVQWAWSSSWRNASTDWTTDRHLIKLYTDGNYAHLNIDGSDVSSGPIVSQTSTMTTTLFRGGESSVSTGVPQKIYACKISKNGSIVLDLIPVRVGQVGYMYDKVSRQLFGNAGTGSFTFGNDIEDGDLQQTDLYVDDEKVGTLITSYAPSTSAKPYVAPSWEALTNSLSDKVDKVASTDNAVVRFNETGGAIQNSGVTINDSNHVTAAKFITSGGTSSQFVKGDGSLDSNTYLTSHQDISGKVDYADGTKTTTTKQMGTTAVTIDGISMYTSESTTYTIQNGYTISIDAQGTSTGYIYQNSNSTILAQDPSGDVEWTNTTGESVVVKIGSVTSGENYAVTIFKKGYYSTIEELTEKIEEAAASGVQADWDESDADDPAYIKNKPDAPTAGDGISISGSTISLKPATSSEIGGIVDADGESANNVYSVTIDPTTHIGLVPIPDATAQSNGILAKEDFATFSGKVSQSDLLGYTPTSGFATINGASITGGGNIVITAGSSSITTIDAVPTQNSQNPVQSGGVYEALRNITFDLITLEEYQALGSNKQMRYYYVAKDATDKAKGKCWRIYLRGQLMGEFNVSGSVTAPVFPMRFPFRFA